MSSATPPVNGRPFGRIFIQKSTAKRWAARLIPFSPAFIPVVAERIFNMFAFNPVAMTDLTVAGIAGLLLGVGTTLVVDAKAKSSHARFERQAVEIKLIDAEAAIIEKAEEIAALNKTNSAMEGRLEEREAANRALTESLETERSLGERPIGKGAMGEVREYFDSKLKRRVAKKILHPTLLQHQEIITRFLKEIKALMSVDSQHVVKVLRQGKEDGAPFFIMEFIEGKTLSHYIKQCGSFDEDKALAIFLQALDAVEAVHAADLIHRDVKSENIVLENTGRAVLLDLGIIKNLKEGESAGLTQSGGILGTLAYMAPEQLLGRAITPKADIYALGVTFYEMLTGKIPFPFTSLSEFVAEADNRKPNLLVLSQDLRLILGNMLENDPSRRRSIQEIKNAIQRAINTRAQQVETGGNGDDSTKGLSG